MLTAAYLEVFVHFQKLSNLTCCTVGVKGKPLDVENQRKRKFPNRSGLCEASFCAFLTFSVWHIFWFDEVR